LSFGNNRFVFSASGDPNLRTDDDAANCAVGSLYLRTDGAPGATLYVKESAGTWTAK